MLSQISGRTGRARAGACLLVVLGLPARLPGRVRAERSLSPPSDLVLEQGQEKPEPIWVILPLKEAW